MTLHCLRAALVARLRGPSVERELDEEIRVHLEMQVEENVRHGMTEPDARGAARRSFGVVASVKEAHRQADGLYWLDTAVQDVRNGVRMLHRAPGFTVAAVLTLALGIGANVAVFTFVDAVILRPLPFDEPQQLVMLSESHIESGQERVGVLPGSLLDWRERSRSFEAISLVWSGPRLITNRQEPARITGAQVSPNFFELMRVEPLLGRTFPSTEAEAAGHERDIVISYGLWQRWFGGTPDVLGQVLESSLRVPLTIVGVMPADFTFPRGAELWGHEPWERSWGRGDRWRQAIGRLGPGISVEAAARELEQMASQLGAEFPDTNAGWTATVDPLADTMLGPVRPALAALLAAVGLVFLLAAVNVATLVLLRSLRRRREQAMRAALGAGRWRLARQSLVEHGILAGGGTLAGGLLAIVILEVLVALAPPAIPRLETITIDLRVLGYLVLVALATVVITGVVPALRSSRVDATAGLKGSDVGRAPGLGGRGLVVAEVALAGILLAGSGLMIRTLVNLQQVDLGFEPAGVVAAELMLPTGRMLEEPQSMRPRWDRLALFYGDLVERVEALPGIERAAAVAAPALAGREAAWFARTGIVPATMDGSPEWRAIQRRVITPGYFDVLRLPLVRGRAFSDQDHALEFLRSGTGRRRGVAIVNQAAARHFWPGQEALGGALTIDGDWQADGRLVVGVVTNARDLAPDVEPQPTVYVPFAESPDFSATLVARGEYGEHPIAAIREELRTADASLAIGELRPLADAYAVALAPRRFTTLVLTTFAGFGLLLAGVGLYGVVAMSVAQRTREFGIRVALGATRERLRQMVLREAAIIVGLGMTIGAVGAATATELLRSQLFGVAPLDAPTWGMTAIILAATGLAAAWLPARRAAHLDPVETLNAE